MLDIEEDVPDSPAVETENGKLFKEDFYRGLGNVVDRMNETRNVFERMNGKEYYLSRGENFLYPHYAISFISRSLERTKKGTHVLVAMRFIYDKIEISEYTRHSVRQLRDYVHDFSHSTGMKFCYVHQ